ncbi:MAG: hydrogenase nickel incorporation protein HypB [Chloroflexi bacterium]|nr:hydrogenase nickel incorporation protein HypB [Chloroflexota bacterium]
MVKQIQVVQNILQSNEEIAAQNRRLIDEAGIFALNMMSSPGSGKTTLIEVTARRLADRYRIAMVNGDITTTLDADRAQQAGAGQAVAINTGGNCHLEAHMVRDALNQLDLAAVDMLIVENVGNLICPHGFKLGVHKRVVVASTPEGADKPYKYPSMYTGADVLVINKMDLLPYLDFDLEHFTRGVEALNPGLVTFPLSCTTGEGVDAWIAWLEAEIAANRG